MNIKWDAHNYQKGFSFVPSYGEDVMNLVTAPKGSRVADLGCGYGVLTDKLKAKGYQVIGIDASADMLAIARASYPNITFRKADILNFHLPEPADALFSNAVLHWINADQQEQALSNIAANLKVGGELVFECGGYGCAEAVHATLDKIFKERQRNYQRYFFFPTIGEYAPLIEKAGMRVEYAILFDRPTPQKGTLSDWIRMFDLAAFKGLPQEEIDDMLNEAEKRLKDQLFIDGIWFIDYVRLRVRARKI